MVVMIVLDCTKRYIVGAEGMRLVGCVMIEEIRCLRIVVDHRDCAAARSWTGRLGARKVFAC